MKVVDKQLIFISSDERDSGSSSDFKISIPSHLLTCQPHQHMRVILNDVVLPYTWYNAQETNRHFEVVEEGGTPFRVSLNIGSYHAMQLRAHVEERLTYASAHSGFGKSYNYSVTFDEISATYSFEIDAPVGINQINFTSQTTDLFGSAYKLLGFAKNSTNKFKQSTLKSTNAISMMLTDALLFHSDLLNSNVDKATGDHSSYHVSNVFGKVMVNTSPFNNLIFLNNNDDYLINVPDKRITEIHFWFTTAEHEPIALNDDFSFTLKLEVLEDDDKTLISQNMGIGELLRLLVLQQRQQHVSQAKVKNTAE